MQSTKSNLLYTNHTQPMLVVNYSITIVGFKERQSDKQQIEDIKKPAQ
jgi:hypothetical protein